ncbi:MAG TPA: DUF5615 family PIN-like protein [Bryobacteraceae bacterium]|nr:DUF5615 family PIN-like protein [Bryobacteraceae bacterium]
MFLRFLADANLDQDIVAGILRREPALDFQLPQGVIPERMPDPEVLAVAASLGRILVTHDVRTMPRHFGEFIKGCDCPGLILIPRSMPIAQAIEELLLIWHVSEVEEWTNRFRRLPL